MRIHQETREVESRGRRLLDVTGEVASVVGRSGVRTGLCTVFLRHTSAGLVIQENADPSVQHDLARWIARLAPESSEWEHDAEGADDMPAHLRAVITRSSESIPITDGQLALGTWQALYLWEHRERGRPRQLVIHVSGVE